MTIWLFVLNVLNSYSSMYYHESTDTVSMPKEDFSSTIQITFKKTSPAVVPLHLCTMEAPIPIETARTNGVALTKGGGHYQCRRPVPMEAARTNGAGPYQWSRSVPMEVACINGGGPYQWRRPVPMEAARTTGGVPYPLKIHRKSTVYAPVAPRPPAHP